MDEGSADFGRRRAWMMCDMGSSEEDECDLDMLVERQIIRLGGGDELGRKWVMKIGQPERRSRGEDERGDEDACGRARKREGKKQAGFS